jgi:hypothetical protein
MQEVVDTDQVDLASQRTKVCNIEQEFDSITLEPVPLDYITAQHDVVHDLLEANTSREAAGVDALLAAEKVDVDRNLQALRERVSVAEHVLEEIFNNFPEGRASRLLSQPSSPRSPGAFGIGSPYASGAGIQGSTPAAAGATPKRNKLVVQREVIPGLNESITRAQRLVRSARRL